MVQIDIEYDGSLHCRVEHGPSASQLFTDAPVDNHGKGESFSPTDLVAAALGSCMATIMGIVAERKKIELVGLKINVQKSMSEDLPRRIRSLRVEISVPKTVKQEDRKILENAALTCPVHQSLHEEIEVSIVWVYE